MSCGLRRMSQPLGRNYGTASLGNAPRRQGTIAIGSSNGAIIAACGCSCPHRRLLTLPMVEIDPRFR